MQLAASASPNFAKSHSCHSAGSSCHITGPVALGRMPQLVDSRVDTRHGHHAMDPVRSLYDEQGILHPYRPGWSLPARPLGGPCQPGHTGAVRVLATHPQFGVADCGHEATSTPSFRVAAIRDSMKDAHYLRRERGGRFSRSCFTCVRFPFDVAPQSACEKLPPLPSSTRSRSNPPTLTINATGLRQRRTTS